MANPNQQAADSAKAPVMETSEAQGVNESLKDLASGDRFQVAEVLEIQDLYLKEKERVLAKYPEIKDELEKSFLTPQVGEHHTEGETMEAHLALVVRELNRLKEGKVNSAIEAEDVRQLLTWSADRHSEDLQDYPFLHDIKKADCLAAVLEEDNKRVELSWEEWRAIEAKGKPYQIELPEERVPVTKFAYFRGTGNKKREEAKNLDFDITTDQYVRMDDGVLLNPVKGAGIPVSWEEWQAIKAKGQPYTYVKESRMVPIKTLAYFQKSKGQEGNHGYKGVQLLREKLGPDKLPKELVLKAIEMHEIAFQEFDQNRMSAKAFADNYGKFSDEELALFLTASYIDFSGSLKADGKPQYKCLSNVINARNNHRLIQRFLDSGAVFSDNKLDTLKNANQILVAEDLEAIREKGETYSAEAVAQALTPLSIAQEHKDKIVSLIATGQPVYASKVIGAALGQVLKGDKGKVLLAIAKVGKDSFVLKPEKPAWDFLKTA